MIKITLPKELTFKDSPFFDQILQASSRGDVLVWNDDYTIATLTLSTDAFFTEEDAKAIVEKGGEVEGFAYWTKILKSEFESKKISQELSDYLEAHPIGNYVSENNEQEEQSEQIVITDDGLELQTVENNANSVVTELPTYQNTFDFIRDVEGESDYIEYLNSANAEYLPMSLSLKL